MRDKRIKPKGGFFKKDVDGFLINPTNRDSIGEPWKSVLDELVIGYSKFFKAKISGVYIRGSVSKGEAIPGIADIDSFAVVEGTYTKESKPWFDEYEADIMKRFPEVAGIEMWCIGKEDLSKSRGLQFLLKTQSLCYWGEDVIPSLPSFKIEKAAYGHLFSLEKTRAYMNDKAKSTFKDESVPEKKAWISWYLKAIVRSGLELLMLEKQEYSRDLYPCYKLFSEEYPEKELLMHRALSLAVFPTDNWDDFWDVSDELVTFLIEEKEKKKLSKN